MKKISKLMASTLLAFLLVSQLIIVLAISNSETQNPNNETSTKEPLKILEIVPSLEYQELSYLCPDTVPFDLNLLIGHDDDIARLKEMVPSLNVIGTKVVPFSYTKPEENSTEYIQMGYLTQNKPLLMEYEYVSRFLVPEGNEKVYDENGEVCLFSSINFDASNRYNRTTSNELYLEKQDGLYINVLGEYYHLVDDCTLLVNDSEVSDIQSIGDDDALVITIGGVVVYDGVWSDLVRYSLNANFVESEEGAFVKYGNKYWNTNDENKYGLTRIENSEEISDNDIVLIKNQNGDVFFNGAWENVGIEEDSEIVVSDGSMTYEEIVSLLESQYATNILYLYNGTQQVFVGTYEELKENHAVSIGSVSSGNAEEGSEERIVVNGVNLENLVIKVMNENSQKHYLIGNEYYLWEDLVVFVFDDFESNEYIAIISQNGVILYEGLKENLVLYDVVYLDTYEQSEDGPYIKIGENYYIYNSLYILSDVESDITFDNQILSNGSNLNPLVDVENTKIYFDIYDVEQGFFKYIVSMKPIDDSTVIDNATLQWVFIGAFDGRTYHFDYDSAKWTYVEEQKNGNYDTWLEATSARYFSNEITYKWSKIVYEALDEGAIEGEFNVVIGDMLRPLSEDGAFYLASFDEEVDYRCVAYENLTGEMIDLFDPDMIYFNMGTNRKLAYFYEKYKNGNDCNYEEYLGLSEIVSNPNIANGIGKLLFERIQNDESVLVFNSEIRTNLVNKEQGNMGLNNLETLFLLSSNMYPNVIEALQLQELFDAGLTRADICDKFLSVTNGTTDELPLFSIDNLDCQYPMFEHKVAIYDNLHSITAKFDEPTIAYSELTKEIMKEEEQLSMRSALRKLMDAKSTSKIKSNTYKILEIQPCASYQGGVTYLSTDTKSNEDYWKIKMLGIDPYFKGDIKVTRVQSRTLQGIDGNLCNDYDIVYIGSNYDLLSHKSSLPNLSWPKLSGNDTISYADLGFNGSNPKVEFLGCDRKLHEFGNFNLYTDAWGNIFMDDPCHWGSKLIDLRDMSAIDARNQSWTGHVAISFKESSFTLTTSDGYMAYVNFPVYLNGVKYQFKATNPFEYKNSDITRYTPSGVVGAFSMNDLGDEFSLMINKLPKWHSTPASELKLWVDYDPNLIEGYRQLYDENGTLIVKSVNKAVENIENTILNIHKRAIYYLDNYQHSGEEKNLYEIAIGTGPDYDALGYMYVLCDIVEAPAYNYIIADQENSVYEECYNCTYIKADVTVTKENNVNIYTTSNRERIENGKLPATVTFKTDYYCKVDDGNYGGTTFIYEGDNIVGIYESGNNWSTTTVAENCSTYTQKVLPEGVVAETKNGNLTGVLLKDGAIVGKITEIWNVGKSISISNYSEDMFEEQSSFNAKYIVESSFKDIEGKPYKKIKLVKDKITNEYVGYIFSDYTKECHTPYRIFITPSSGEPPKKIETVYNDTKLDGTLYNHVGDLIQLGGSEDRKQYNFAGITFKANEFVTTRLSGNDISLKNYEQLVAFAKSGKLLLFSHDFYNEDGSVDNSVLDRYSYMYQLIHNHSIQKYDITKLDGYDFNYLIDTDYRIDILNEPLAYRDYTTGSWGASSVAFEDKIYTFDELGIRDASEKVSAFYLPNDSFSIEFKVTQLGNYQTGYNVKLFMDSISDGVFDDAEEVVDVVVTDANGNIVASNALVSGGTYKITFHLDNDYAGVVHWQLRLAKNEIEGAYKSADNYFAVKKNEGEKNQILKILQLLPTDGSTTFNLKTDAKFQSYLSALDDFDVVIFTAKESNLVTDGELNTYAIPFETCIETYESCGLEYEGLNGMKLLDFDIIVLGFGDYKTCATNQHLLDALKSFVESGKSLILSHDNIDFNNNIVSSKTSKHTYFNKYFRTIAGQDRFGVNERVDDERIDFGKVGTTEDNTYFLRYGLHQSESSLMDFKNLMVGKGFDYSSNSESLTTEGIEGISDGFLLSLNNSEVNGGQYLIYDFYNVYKLGTHDKDASTNWNDSSSPETSHLTCNNRGQISTFPYYIKDDMNVAPTHPQYYQVNLDDKDLTVWYTIEGSGSIEGASEMYNYYLSADTKDARNNYYIYTNGNIIYTGIGHSSEITDDEYKLFVNTLFMAFRKPFYAADILITNESAVNISDLTYLYVDSDYNETTELLDVDIIGNTTLRLHFQMDDRSKYFRKVNYIQLRYKNKDGDFVSLSNPIYTKDGVLLQNAQASICTKLSNLSMTDVTSNIYLLGTGKDFYTDVDLEKLMKVYYDNETFVLSSEQSFKMDLQCIIYSSYGDNSQLAYTMHDVSIIKRDLFDLQ